MASAIKLLATQMEAMEASFLTVFFQAATKIADLTDSKLFFLMETSDGVQKIGGNPQLKFLFQAAKLVPRNSDVVFDEEEVEEGFEKISSSSSSSETPYSKLTSALKDCPKLRSRKRKSDDPLPNESNAEEKSPKISGSDDCSIKDKTIKEEDLDLDLAAVCDEEAKDVENDASDLEFTDDEPDRSQSHNSNSVTGDEEWEPSGVKKRRAKAKFQPLYSPPCPNSGKPSSACQCCLGPDWVLSDASLRSEVWKYFAQKRQTFPNARCRSCQEILYSASASDLQKHQEQSHGIVVSGVLELWSHYLKSKPDVNQTKCMTCGFVFNRASTTTLRYHLESAHGIQASKIVAPRNDK